jgi:hypothetical protein
MDEPASKPSSSLAGELATAVSKPVGLNADKLGVWLSAFFGCVVLVIVLEVPAWIPEWEPYIDGLVVCLVLASMVACVASFKAAASRIRERVKPPSRWLAQLLLAALMFAVWSFGAVIAAFAVGGGPLSATYIKQLHFEEIDTTIYLYDSSFLDPETTVYRRRSWLPVREQVMHLGRAPEAVHVVLRGNVLMINDRAVDLRNGN